MPFVKSALSYAILLVLGESKVVTARLFKKTKACDHCAQYASRSDSENLPNTVEIFRFVF